MSIQDQNRITALEQRLAALEAWLAEFKVKIRADYGASPMDVVSSGVIREAEIALGRKGKK